MLQLNIEIQHAQISEITVQSKKTPQCILLILITDLKD